MNHTFYLDKLKLFFLNKPKTSSVVFFVVLLALASFAITQRYIYLKEVEKNEANKLLKKAEHNLEKCINSALLAAINLALAINDEGVPEGFEQLGIELVDSNVYVDGIQLVPNGVVKYVYPYEQNKAALDYNILGDPKTSKEAFNAIYNKKFYIAGPLELKQGGTAVIGRLPIFRKNEFWGFSAVLINLETLIKNAGIGSVSPNGFYYQFSKINPNTKIEASFLPEHNSTVSENISSKYFPESNWTISIRHINNHEIFKNLLIISVLALLIAWVFSTLLYYFLSLPSKLEKLVNERTLELNQSNQALQKTNSELDRFVYSASHDLRAPIKSMLGLIDIAKESIPSDNRAQIELLNMLNKSVLKLDDLIEDILNYSRNSRTELAKDKIDFKLLLERILEEFKYVNGTKLFLTNIHIKQDEIFISDNRRIQVILNNLISNAFKYSDNSKHEALIKITVECTKEHAIIIIEDNGIGIANNNKDRIFEMFYRATKFSSGSGLGLYIVKETIDKLNGSVLVDSELHQGTTVTVVIPNQHLST